MSNKTKDILFLEREVKFLTDKNNIDYVALFEKLLLLSRDVLKIEQDKVNGRKTPEFLSKVKSKNDNIYKILNYISKNFVNGDILFREKHISTRENANRQKHGKDEYMKSYFGLGQNYFIVEHKIFDIKMLKGDIKEVFTAISTKNAILLSKVEELLDTLALEI